MSFTPGQSVYVVYDDKVGPAFGVGEYISDAGLFIGHVVRLPFKQPDRYVNVFTDYVKARECFFNEIKRSIRLKLRDAFDFAGRGGPKANMVHLSVEHLDKIEVLNRRLKEVCDD